MGTFQGHFSKEWVSRLSWSSAANRMDDGGNINAVIYPLLVFRTFIKGESDSLVLDSRESHLTINFIDAANGVHFLASPPHITQTSASRCLCLWTI